MTYRVGIMQGKQTVYIPKSMLTESVIGQTYELKIKTKGVKSPRYTAIVLQKSLKEKFNATLLYFEVTGDTITIQIEGSPFAWSLLLVFLPQILGILGIVVSLVAVYLLVSGVPSWVYGLGILGIILISFGPSIARVFTGGEKK